MASSELTVLIADDEELICSLIKKLIKWDEHNLRFLGFATNGEDLYRQIDALHPDIVITDINMPLLSGLETIGKIRGENITCRFIVISGYRQFEYAHEALKYGVEDYILKPIEADELNHSLAKVASSLRSQNDSEQKAAADLENNNRLKQHFMSSLFRPADTFSSSVTLEDIRSRYGINFKPGCFQALVVCFDVKDQSSDFCENASHILEKTESLFLNELEDICHQILFYRNTEVLTETILINYAPDSKQEIHHLIRDFYIKATNLIDLFKGIEVTVGISCVYNDSSDIRTAVQDTIYTMISRMYDGCGCIIECDNTPQNTDASYYLFSSEQEEQFFIQLSHAYETLDTETVSRMITELFDWLHHHFYAPACLRLSTRLVDLFFATCHTAIEKLGNEDFLRTQLRVYCGQATSLSILSYCIENVIVNTMESLKENSLQKSARPVREAIHFIELHYSENIGLDTTARFVNLNAAYLSDIFKNVTGQTFMEYLTEFRISKAKELLRTSNLSVKEITHLVGYEDSHYFSKVFKKSVGIKPTDYRKIYG